MGNEPQPITSGQIKLSMRDDAGCFPADSLIAELEDSQAATRETAAEKLSQKPYKLTAKLKEKILARLKTEADPVVFYLLGKLALKYNLKGAIPILINRLVNSTTSNKVFRAECQTILEEFGQAAIPQLKTAYQASPNFQLAKLLQEMGDSFAMNDHTRIVLANLTSPDQEKRAQAASEIQHFQVDFNADVRAKISERLEQEKDPTVYGLLIDIIIKNKVETALPWLVKGLSGENWQACAYAIYKLNAKSLQPSLENLYQTKKSRFLAEILLKWGNPKPYLNFVKEDIETLKEADTRLVYTDPWWWIMFGGKVEASLGVMQMTNINSLPGQGAPFNLDQGQGSGTPLSSAVKFNTKTVPTVAALLKPTIRDNLKLLVAQLGQQKDNRAISLLLELVKYPADLEVAKSALDKAINGLSARKEDLATGRAKYSEVDFDKAQQAIKTAKENFIKRAKEWQTLFPKIVAAFRNNLSLKSLPLILNALKENISSQREFIVANLIIALEKAPEEEKLAYFNILQGWANDQNHLEARPYVIRILAALGDISIAPLLKRIIAQDPAALYAVQALADVEISPGEFKATFAQVLYSPQTGRETKIIAAAALARAGQRSALGKEGVKLLFEHAQELLSGLAVTSKVKIRPEDLIAALAKIIKEEDLEQIKKFTASYHPQVIRAGFILLQELGNPKHLALILPKLREDNFDARTLNTHLRENSLPQIDDQTLGLLKQELRLDALIAIINLYNHDKCPDGTSRIITREIRFWENELQRKKASFQALTGAQFSTQLIAGNDPEYILLQKAQQAMKMAKDLISQLKNSGN